MSRMSGRSTWIAVPAALICVAVIGVLVWLAAPMVPVAAQWVADTLRAPAVRAEQAAEQPAPAALVAGGLPIDCRDLYPDSLWAELIWHGDVLLDQSTDLPPVSDAEITEALAPTVRLTCSWDFSGADSIVTTISSVGADAAPAAEAALTAQGFDCVSADRSLACGRTRDGVTEAHALGGGLWLASVRAGWGPDEYADRLAGYVWG